MHSGRASWAGQTFALAKCSDSHGKKQRNRMTKEERRKMAESFIKRHRASNNGNFPSLNLTHKEVGGSFYTVREIVREIIQENRVLCPGNVTSPSFMLDDSSVIIVEPSSMERWEKVPEVPPTYSSIMYDHNTPNNIKVDFDHNSNGAFDRSVIVEEPITTHSEEEYLEKVLGKVDKTQEELIHRDSGDGILETALLPDQVIALSSMQVGSDQEMGSRDGQQVIALSSMQVGSDQEMGSRDGQQVIALSSMQVGSSQEMGSIDVQQVISLSSMQVGSDQEMGSIDVHQVIALSSMQLGSDQEMGSVDELSSSLASSSTAVDQKNTERTLSNSCECIKLEPLASSGGLLRKELNSNGNSETERQLVMAGTLRESSKFEQKNPGENPIWTVIKGFVASFIKFWVE